MWEEGRRREKAETKGEEEREEIGKAGRGSRGGGKEKEVKLTERGGREGMAEGGEKRKRWQEKRIKDREKGKVGKGIENQGNEGK